MLSEFREHLKPSGFEKIAQLITANFLSVMPLALIKVGIPDATDMPANCSGFAKKNADVRPIVNAPKNTPRKELQRGSERKKVAKVPILLDIRSIPCVSG
jgi:hypothetical protein